MIRRETWYFPEVGPKNTGACLDLLDKAVEEGFQHLVVASTTGDSGQSKKLGLTAIRSAGSPPSINLRRLNSLSAMKRSTSLA